jgi:Anaphase-promoting complex subunit 4 WD40 domain
VCFSPDGKWLAHGAPKRKLALRETAKFEVVRTLPGRDYGQIFPTVVAFSPDSKWFVSDGPDTIGVWDVHTGKSAEFYKKLLEADGDGQVASSLGGQVNAVAISKDGKTLAWAGYYGLSLWDLPPQHRVRPLGLIHVNSVAFSPDSKYLASAHGRYLGEAENPITLRLWNVQTAREARRFVDDPGNIVAVAYSPDGRMLATGSEDGAVRLWEVASGKVRLRLDGLRRKITCIAFSPAGDLLATGSEDTSLLLWNTNPSGGDDKVDDKEQLWSDLAAVDAVRAYRSVSVLARTPGVADFFKSRLRPVQPIEPDRLQRILKDMESTNFAKRQKANLELKSVIGTAHAAVREAVKQTLDADLKRQLESALTEYDQRAITLPELSAQELQEKRAVEVLERARTKEAGALLRELAAGLRDAELTRDAAAALARLEKSRADK